MLLSKQLMMVGDLMLDVVQCSALYAAHTLQKIWHFQGLAATARQCNVRFDALWREHSWVLSTRRQLLSPALRSVLQQKAWKVLVCPEGKVLRVSLVPAMQPLMVQLATAHFCSVPGGRHSSKCSQHGLNKAQTPTCGPQLNIVHQFSWNCKAHNNNASDTTLDW